MAIRDRGRDRLMQFRGSRAFGSTVRGRALKTSDSRCRMKCGVDCSHSPRAFLVSAGVTDGCREMVCLCVLIVQEGSAGCLGQSFNTGHMGVLQVLECFCEASLMDVS